MAENERDGTTTSDDGPSRLLVGYDGSDGAQRALAWATREAQHRGWPLQIVTCFQMSVSADSGFGYEPPVAEAGEAIHESTEQLATTAIEWVRRAAPELDVEAEVVAAPPAVELAERSKGALAVVVGTRGASGLLTELLGSVATAVLHKAKAPFVAVPAGFDADAAPRGKVVVGTDGSAASSAALDWAHDAATRAGAVLQVVHSWMYPYDVIQLGGDDPRVTMRAAAAARARCRGGAGRGARPTGDRSGAGRGRRGPRPARRRRRGRPTRARLARQGWAAVVAARLCQPERRATRAMPRRRHPCAEVAAPGSAGPSAGLERTSSHSRHATNIRVTRTFGSPFTCPPRSPAQ